MGLSERLWCVILRAKMGGRIVNEQGSFFTVIQTRIIGESVLTLCISLGRAATKSSISGRQGTRAFAASLIVRAHQIRPF